MRHKLLGNTLIYTIGGFLHPMLNFLLLPLYTYYLEPNDLGVIAAIYALIALLSVFYTFTLDRSLLRLYWECNNEAQKKLFLSTVTISIGVLCFVMGLATFLLSSIIQSNFLEVYSAPILGIAIFMTIEKVFLNIIQSVYRIKENAKAFVVLNISNFTTRIILVVLFMVVLDYGLMGYFYAALLNSFLFFLVYAYIMKSWFVLKFDFNYFKSALRFAIPYFPGMTGSWIIGQSDRIFVSTLMSLSDLGIYAISLQISKIISIINASFKNAYLPLFFKKATQDSTGDAKKDLTKYNNTYIHFLLFAGFAVSLFSKELVLLLDNKYEQAHIYVPVLIASVVLFSLSSTLLGASLQQSKKTLIDSSLGVVTSLLTLLLNYTLIRSYGLYGAMFAKFTTSVFHFVVGYVFVRRFSYYIPVKFGFMFLMISVYVAWFLMFLYLEFSLIFSLLTKSVLCLAIVVFLVKRLKLSVVTNKMKI